MFGEALPLQLHVCDLEDDWDFIMRDEDEDQSPLALTREGQPLLQEPASSDQKEVEQEEDLFPNLTLSKMTRSSLASEVVPVLEREENVSVDSKGDESEVRVECKDGDSDQSRAADGDLSESLRRLARMEEIQLLQNMGFGAVSDLLPLLEKHVNGSLERVDTEGVQRIIGFLLSQQTN